MKTLKKVNVQRTDRINRIGMGGMNLSRTQLKKKKGGGGVCKRRSSSEGRGSLFRKWEGIFFRKWEDLLRKGGRAIERQTWTRHRRAWKGSADALEQEGRRCAPPAPSTSLSSFSCSFSSSFSFSSSYSSSSASSSASSSLLASFSCSSSCFLVVALILLLSLQWKALRCPPTCPLLLLHLCNVRSQLFSKKL